MENRIKTVLLLAGLTAFMIFMGRVLGGRQGMYFAFILAVAMNFFSYWFSDKIVLRMYGAQEVSPEDAPQLHQIVEELAREAGSPRSTSSRMSPPTPLPPAATPSTPRWPPPKGSYACSPPRNSKGCWPTKSAT
jgi:Zn-dependent protease with chaperone function